MKIAQINVTCGTGSTGKICEALSEKMTQNGIENAVFYSSGQSDLSKAKKYMTDNDVKFQALKSHIFGKYGFCSSKATSSLIKELKTFKPDIVHLHNLHGHNCNLKKLFLFFQETKIKVLWTFHDCWAFTAYCPHFTMVGCDKWKTECKKCPQRKKFSWFFDKSKYLFENKKEFFTSLDLTIVTPSEWLAELVKQSFLKDYPVKVINNGIDLSVFRPRESDFRKKYGIPENKFLLLGVAFDWGVRKGLDVFIELFKRLPQEQFQIILVGTNKNIDKRLPKGIISIHRTQNQIKLAEIYTAADVFINPTREEVLGLVNIESLACGTPVITFDTGGSPECIDKTCGAVVPCGDVETLEKEIIRVCEQKLYSVEDCIKRAKVFDQNEKYKEYLSLYEELYEGIINSRISD